MFKPKVYVVEPTADISNTAQEIIKQFNGHHLSVTSKFCKTSSEEIPIVINLGVQKLPMNIYGALGPSHLVINSQVPQNRLDQISLLNACKLHVPEKTVKNVVAGMWLNQGYDVIVKSPTNTVFVKGGEESLPPNSAGKYKLRYIEHDVEFRVSIAFGEVVAVAQKKRMGKKKLASIGLSKYHPKLMNYKNGWVLSRKSFCYQESGMNSVKAAAISAATAMGADLCMVDVWCDSSTSLGGKKLPMYTYIGEISTVPSLINYSERGEYFKKISKKIEEVMQAYQISWSDYPGFEVLSYNFSTPY